MVNNSNINIYDVRNYYLEFSMTEKNAIERAANLVKSLKQSDNLKTTSIEDWCNICGYDFFFEKVV